MTGRASKPRKPPKSTRPGDPGGGPVAPARQRTASLFPPHALREYALLADGERGALIGPKGDIAWMCEPSWDSGSVFSSLIGGSGVYAIWPADRFTWGGFYEAGSLIWHSRWVTDADAITECREALAFPGEPGRLVLLRRMMACDGTARVRVRLQPRADYDRRPLRPLHQDAAGLWTGRAGDLYLRWSGAVGAATAASRQRGELLELTLRVDEGRHADLVLELSDRPFDGPPPDPDEAWAATEHGWQQAVPKLEKVTARRDAVHAYAVMR